MCTFPQARNKFLKAHTWKNMRFGSIHFFYTVFVFSHFHVFSTTKKAAQTEKKKAHVGSPFCALPPPKKIAKGVMPTPKTGPTRSPFRVLDSSSSLSWVTCATTHPYAASRPVTPFNDPSVALYSRKPSICVSNAQDVSKTTFCLTDLLLVHQSLRFDARHRSSLSPVPPNILKIFAAVAVLKSFLRPNILHPLRSDISHMLRCPESIVFSSHLSVNKLEPHIACVSLNVSKPILSNTFLLRVRPRSFWHPHDMCLAGVSSYHFQKWWKHINVRG